MSWSNALAYDDFDVDAATGLRWKKAASEDIETLEEFEGVRIDALPDASEYAGVDTSAETIAYSTQKRQLLATVQEYLKAAPSWDGEDTRVTTGAVQTASRFIASLPDNRVLPQVAPDGEGDLMLVWPAKIGDCVVTVEQNRLHLVADATAPASTHVDGVPFADHRIPMAVLHRLPLR